jgi:signal transduction histidine kinase
VTPKNTLQPYFGEQIESRDGVHRVHISYPVLADVETADGNVATEFNGVVSTAFSLADMGKELESELSSELKGRLGIIDTAGTIIYSPGRDFAGLNVFGEEYQTAISKNVIPEDQIGRWNEQLRASLESGKRGWGDFSISGIITTSAYQPIIINGRHVMTFYLELPHTMTAQTAALIEQQRNFSIISVIAIAGVSLALAIAVLKWNTRLQSTISQRTDDLAKKSQALQTSNKLLIESNKELELRNQELVVARKLAEDHEKTQKEFINIAAHELRTPIQPLVGIAEMLGAKLRDDSTESIPITRPEIEIIVRNANRLMNLSSDILAVSRIESSSLNLNKEEIDLEEKVRSVVDDMRHFISDGKKVEVRFLSKVPREELPFMVEADRERIFQVLANLLSNARKFTEAGQIVITVESKDGDAVVSVMDTGSGIDRDIFPKLFTKFATKSQRGTGLGLFISKSIVEAHGGRIWAQNNKDGKGATFSFTIPVLKKQLPAPDESRRE